MLLLTCVVNCTAGTPTPRLYPVVQWSVHWAPSRTTWVLVLAGARRCALETCGKKNARLDQISILCNIQSRIIAGHWMILNGTLNKSYHWLTGKSRMIFSYPSTILIENACMYFLLRLWTNGRICFNLERLLSFSCPAHFLCTSLR